MAIRNANKEDREYRKKLAEAKAKLAAAKAAKVTPPQGTVKVVKPSTQLSRDQKNVFADEKVAALKSGAIAKAGAKAVTASNILAKSEGTSSAGTVKINSKRVRTPRIAGGLMGGGGAGNWRNLFK